MRVLRASCYATPGLPPITTVVRDCDIVDTLESARVASLVPGALVLHDLFEVDRGTNIRSATMQAVERIDAEQEGNMAVLYHYNGQWLGNVSSGGVLTATRPAPLTPDEIEVVFDQLKSHPNYDGQLIASPSNDGTLVQMKPDGTIERKDAPK